MGTQDLEIRTGAKFGCYKMICFCPRASSLGEMFLETWPENRPSENFDMILVFAVTRRIRRRRRMRIEDAGKFKRVRSVPARFVP